MSASSSASAETSVPLPAGGRAALLRIAMMQRGVNLYGIGDAPLCDLAELVGDDALLGDIIELDPLPAWVCDALVVPASGYLKR